MRLMLPSAADDERGFEDFLAVEGVRVRRALLARYGVDLGTEAWADAVAWAWEHRDEIASMSNSARPRFVECAAPV